MNLFRQVKALIYKDLVLEWRQRYALNGILLYVASTVMLVYMAFTSKAGGMDDITWIVVFWIILLFASVNAVTKSFMQERVGRQLYYYTLTSPQAVILSKIIYNTFLLLLIAGVSLVAYTVLLENPLTDIPLFLLAVILGSVSFSMCFTLISAIAAKAGGNASLMPILSFPIVIPLLALLITVSKGALGLGDSNLNKDIGVLVAINGILGSVSFILFPYLWRD